MLLTADGTLVVDHPVGFMYEPTVSQSSNPALGICAKAVRAQHKLSTSVPNSNNDLLMEGLLLCMDDGRITS